MLLLSRPIDSANSVSPPPPHRSDDSPAQSGLVAGPSPRDAGFFRSTLAPLRRYVARLVGCETEAQDIVQDAQTRVFAVMQRAEVTHPRALLYTTARHLAIDELKHRSRAPFRDRPDAAELTPGRQPGIEETVMAREEWGLLQQAIAELAPECRAVLLLRTVEGLSHGEISRRLGVPRKTVEKRLYRAIRQLHASRQAQAGIRSPLVPLPDQRRSAAH